jgi:hypothetical protein
MPRAYGITNAAPYASAPAVGAAGDTYFNTTDKSLYVSDGTAWSKVGPGAGGPPSGAAGGDLSGSYPSPRVRRANWATTAGLPTLAADLESAPEPPLMLRSPNGRVWALTVTDDGTLHVDAV